MAEPRGPITLLATSRKARRWTVGVGIALFLFGGIAYVVWWRWAFSKAMHDLFTGKTGPVSLHADWPRPLKELLDESGEIEIDELPMYPH